MVFRVYRADLLSETMRGPRGICKTSPPNDQPSKTSGTENQEGSLKPYHDEAFSGMASRALQDRKGPESRPIGRTLTTWLKLCEFPDEPLDGGRGRSDCLE